MQGGLRSLEDRLQFKEVPNTETRGNLLSSRWRLTRKRVWEPTSAGKKFDAQNWVLCTGNGVGDIEGFQGEYSEEGINPNVGSKSVGWIQSSVECIRMQKEGILGNLGTKRLKHMVA